MLLVRVRAQPAEGQANAALEAALAKALGLPRAAVGVVKGGKSRLKAVALDGVTQDQLAAALPKP